jgi:hypothetical protein
MDKFLDYIERFKFAIFGTLFVHIFIFLASNFITVQDMQKVPVAEVKIEIPLDDIEFDEEMLEMLDMEKPDLKPQDISNLATNENDDREKSYEDYSINPEDLSAEAKLSAKELEAQYFKEAAANNDRTDFAANMEEHEVNGSKSQENKNNHGGANQFAGDVMISYNLTDRKSYSLPNPGYTCNGSGVVVIIVKVDKSGVVKDATYSSGKSRSATSCMIERALKYAKKSRFDYSAGSGLQQGTITYKFIGK